MTTMNQNRSYRPV